MSEDPFFLVKEDVQKAMRSSEALFKRWTELTQLQQTKPLSQSMLEELRWTTGELNQSLKAIDWDIEDLEETVGIVEANPAKFQIPQKELQERRAFITMTIKFVREMRTTMQQADAEAQRAQRRDLMAPAPTRGGSGAAPSAAAGNGLGGNGATPAGAAAALSSNGKQPAGGYNRYAKLEASITQDNADYIRGEQARQQQLVAEQDVQIDMISSQLRTVKEMSTTIHNELDRQNDMLDTLGNDMDNTENRLTAALKKADKVLELSKDKKQTCCIVLLIIAIIVMMVVLFV
ncbi:syntaxin-6 [Capsaspora owczarzaki ATCC 30864]|uniref:Syntaxin-6 n=1 Tax=Capsaspora owczarzaki (strain ATCC 30864) TaxID=595528 RepID=A0A0D2WRQ3_CAPO3|nr:syntaxin-6 [Capsaspora owczarzaki ATCC 30864]KJE94620.1 syntaxin-6 [Capsaspora owczarzaki ATCC 30864]|eukprot:XP_004346925.1 syntaxin-6 [Capsaspora owczarzaki ATCC 30864]